MPDSQLTISFVFNCMPSILFLFVCFVINNCISIVCACFVFRIFLLVGIFPRGSTPTNSAIALYSRSKYNVLTRRKSFHSGKYRVDAKRGLLLRLMVSNYIMNANRNSCVKINGRGRSF